MAWNLTQTQAVLSNEAYRFTLVPNANAIALLFRSGQTIDSRRRKYGGASLQRDEYLYGTGSFMEFVYTPLWNPLTFISRDVHVNGSWWTIDNASLLVYAYVDMDLDVWEFYV